MSQNPDLTIRRANHKDASLLAELGARTFSETFAPDNIRANISSYLAASFNTTQQSSELADPASIFFIAKIGGIVTGYAKLHVGEPAAGVEGHNSIELERLYVLHDWLGRGIGGKLISVCLEEARRAGHGTIWLGVWERNERAQAFYRKWGISYSR